MTRKLSESEAQPFYCLVSAKVKNGKKQLLVQDSRRATGDPGTEDESKSEREIKTASTSIKPSTSQTLLEEKSGLWKYISRIVKKAQNIFNILNFDLLGLFTDNPFFSRSWSGLRKPSCLITTQSICYHGYEQDILQKNFFTSQLFLTNDERYISKVFLLSP